MPGGVPCKFQRRKQEGLSGSPREPLEACAESMPGAWAGMRGFEATQEGPHALPSDYLSLCPWTGQGSLEKILPVPCSEG